MTSTFLTNLDAMWQAVCDRDAESDGRFVYAVETTGVYCRPSCPARRPRRANVSFHPDAVAAERKGFRACQRCRPNGPTKSEEHAAAVADLCRFIAAELAEDRTPTVDALAERAGWSVSHVHRVFRRFTGVTPRAYAASLKADGARLRLTTSPSVTEAVFDAGYSSASRFYERADAALGMSPSVFREGAHEQTIRFGVGQCSLGAILVAATAVGVCAVSIGDEPEPLVHALEERFSRATLIGGDAEFERLMARVVGLVDGGDEDPLPLDVRGTAFQIRVWEALTRVPKSTTTTYSALAAAIGRPSSVRAVANACGRNPVAVAIPCHRVVRTDGSLSGYRWGIERKRALLRRESDR